MEGLKQFFETSGKIDNASPEYRQQDTSPPDWAVAIVDAVIQLYREWSKHPGSGRPLPPETYNASFAAGLASDYHKNQKAPERFLKTWLDIHETDPERLADLVQALLEELRRQWAKPFDDPELWVLDSERCLAYLRKVVPREATRIRSRREMEDKPWGRRQQRVENIPEQCEFVPDIHDKENSEASAEDLLEFQTRELELHEQIKDALPERQHQVFLLLAEGLDYEEIGRRLGISPSTARVHRLHASKNPELRRIAGQ
jgi:RNA polymerase sigma factor (sigma-70 family)